MPDTSIRTPAILLTIVTWSFALVLLTGGGVTDRLGNLKGMDFLQFYAAGAFVAEGRIDELYDWHTFAAELPRFTPAAGDLLYLPVYPPLVALVFAPFSRLSYSASLTAWVLVTIAVYGAAVTVMARRMPRLRARASDVAWLASGFPPFVLLVMNGQISALWLASVTAGVVAWLAGRHFLAGLALGLLSLKPPFLFAVLTVLLVLRAWRVLAGALVMTLLTTGATWAWVGSEVVWLYMNRLIDVASTPERFEPRVWQMHSLQPFFILLLGRSVAATVLYAGSAVAVLVLVRRVWRHARDARLQLAAFIVAVVLLNPHLYVYDLVVLAPALLLLGDTLSDVQPRTRRRLGELIHAVFLAALVGPLAAVTHVQLTPVLLIAILGTLGARSTTQLGEARVDGT